MNGIRNNLFDRRFIAEVLIAAGYAIINGAFLGKLGSFLEKAASSPQAGKVLFVFVQYLVLAAFLFAIFAVERAEVRRSLFGGFSVLILLLTLRYMLKWFYLGASAFPGKIPNLNESLPWLDVMAFLNVSYIPILISSLQVAKIVEGDREKPLYALLVFNFTLVAVYLFLFAPFFAKNQQNMTTGLIVFYQFLVYFSVYFLFAYSPFFVSSGYFWKRIVESFGFAFKKFLFTALLSAGLVVLIYLIPFGIYGAGYNARSYGVYVASVWASVLFTALTYYAVPAYFILTSVKAKEYGK